MRHHLLLAAAYGLVPVCSVIPAAKAIAASPQAAVDQLLAADSAFSAASANVELADGIGAMFDAETVMPVPGGFAQGKAAIITALRANPANVGARAIWTPVRGGVSADGGHGFTIGFMTITADGKPDRRAKYVAYWVRRADGWRAAIYKRAGRPEGEVSLDMMPPSLPSRALSPSSDPAVVAAWRASLDRAERDFSDEAQRIGIGPAFVKNGSPDATNIGGGPGFTIGNTAIGADVASQGGPGVNWAPNGGVIVSATGDFGITWGLIRPNGPPAEGQPAAFPYTTIWRRASPDQPWKYIAE